VGGDTFTLLIACPTLRRFPTDVTRLERETVAGETPATMTCESDGCSVRGKMNGFCT
jgi:hypothetical protein